jgi:ubiquinone/menaquinone biosynthesis C-methylase UbiE
VKRRAEAELMDLAEEADAYCRADFSEVNAAFVDRLIALTPEADAMALDLGCGPADIPARLVRVRPRWRVFGVDGSRAMLRHAPDSTGRERLHLVQADAKYLPFPDSTFDVVFSNSILHHVADPVRLWRETSRVAKPGGEIFARDLFRPPSEEAAREIVSRYAAQESEALQDEYFRSLLSAYTPEEISRQLHTAGLGHLEVARVTDRHVDVAGRTPAG